MEAAQGNGCRREPENVWWLSLPMATLSAFPLPRCRRHAREVQVIPDIRRRWAAVDCRHTETVLLLSPNHTCRARSCPRTIPTHCSRDADRVARSCGTPRWLRLPAECSRRASVIPTTCDPRGLSQKPPVAKVGPDSDHLRRNDGCSPGGGAAAERCRQDGRDARSGDQGFPGENGRKGESAAHAGDGRKNQGLQRHCSPRSSGRRRPGRSWMPGRTTIRFRVRSFT